ncbi:hypothetical protein ACFVT2_14130 [Streptomyces sp. NPDC058000]|uniref:hypothetical protein n=1 Tax=Streptomyces sp. NPDC058000 TaxID=3346299 RepID=UPI0036EE0978
MDNQLYDYSPITERDPISWPGGARIACYVGLNVEHYQVDRPSTSIFPAPPGSPRTRSTTAGATTVRGWASDG